MLIVILTQNIASHLSGEVGGDGVSGVRQRCGGVVGQVGELVLGDEEGAELHHRGLGVVVLVVHDGRLPDGRFALVLREGARDFVVESFEVHLHAGKDGGNAREGHCEGCWCEEWAIMIKAPKAGKKASNIKD